MESKETLQGFYNRIDCAKLKGDNNKPHINVFERSACSVHIPYSRRDYYKATLILGNGRVAYADKIVVIDRPALMFSTPLIPYAWMPSSENQEGWFCIFNDAFVKERDQLLTDLPMFQVGFDHIFFPDAESVNKISALFRSMMSDNQDCYEYKSDLLRSYLHLIVHEGLKMQPSELIGKNINASTRITNLFLELLERQFPVDAMKNALQLTRANDFAGVLSVHINHLNRSVKEITGKTTSEHIANRIALEAQALIRHTDWSISEIAYSLGFEYPAHFTNFYKKKTGESPAAFRRNNV